MSEDIVVRIVDVDEDSLCTRCSHPMSDHGSSEFDEWCDFLGCNCEGFVEV